MNPGGEKTQRDEWRDIREQRGAEKRDKFRKRGYIVEEETEERKRKGGEKKSKKAALVRQQVYVFPFVERQTEKKDIFICDATNCDARNAGQE